MRTSLFLVTCIIFLALAAENIFAEENKNYALEFATEVSHITYKEPGVMEEKGLMYGLLGSYTYQDGYMAKIELRYSQGEVDYTSASSGSMSDIDDYMVELRGLWGYGFARTETFILTPYLGIGYRYLNDDMYGRYTTTGAFGYEREIKYIYSPIGVEVITILDNGWSISPLLEFDYFWDGAVKSHLGWRPGYYDIENDQDKGYGLRGSVKFQKAGGNINFAIEPFVRYWNIKRSKYTTDPGGTTWYEPKNTSTEFGSKFAISF